MTKSVNELFGVELPIIQAPMAGVQGSGLAAAVSAAGGLGSLPCAMLSLEKIVSEIEAIRSVTANPFNLNFFCHQSREYDKAQEKVWLEELQPHFTEHGVCAEDIAAGAPRNPFNHDIADALETLKPAIISFHFGLPAGDLLDRVKSWGTTVMSSATTVAEAQWLEDNGADAVIAQGLEAGGHRGMFLTEDLSTQVGTFALLPQIIAAVDIPVIAAGGFSDAASVNAAIGLNATAVQLGTSFLLCDEANTSAVHRAALQSDVSRHTTITNVFSGRPARSIVNRAVLEVGPICEKAMDFPHAATAMTALRQQLESIGSADYSPLWCGQNATGCKELPAAQLLLQLASHEQ